MPRKALPRRGQGGPDRCWPFPILAATALAAARRPSGGAPLCIEGLWWSVASVDVRRRCCAPAALQATEKARRAGNLANGSRDRSPDTFPSATAAADPEAAGFGI